MPEKKTGVFKAARPFSSFRSIAHNGAIFGTIMGIQRLSSKSLELLRQREDYINDIFGFGVTYKYYDIFLASAEKRLLIHNRIFGVAVLTAVAYGHVAV
jgi:hypothetical protein